jgi:hypothetical protein
MRMCRWEMLFEVQTQTRGWVTLRFLPIVALTSILFVVPAHGQTVSPGPQRQSIGSMNSVGEVLVNESRAPSELTIFSGDTLRTGETGTAILTTNGQGSLQISHDSQVAFTGDPRYFAELKLGTIFAKSLGGTAGTGVRAGNFVVVPTNRNELTSVTIARMTDGSFLITCSAGNVGVISLQESPGLFLQAGQSAQISPTSELVALGKPAQAPQSAGKSHRLWIYLGLAGGGIAAGAAAAIAHGGTHPPISPSSP